jgi:hypothetical protein
MKRASTHTTPTPRSTGLADLSRKDVRPRPAGVRKRPPRIVFVVACSQRKRTLAPIELRLSSINARPDKRSIEWTRRIREVQVGEDPAHELYLGDHWRSACEAYRLAKQYSNRSELWVISAGYGLIPSSKLIKPYSATFASGSADSVWRGPADGDRKSRLQNWWRALPHDATLVDLLQRDGTIVVAAGAPYLAALSDDLATAVDNDRTGDRISVVSAGTRGNGSLLPVSGNFRAAVGGTDAALNTRLLALLAAEPRLHRFRRSAMTTALTQFAARQPATQRTEGKAVTDDEVASRIDVIRRRLPAASRTQALRELRRAGIACEQSRFAAIWNAVLGDQHGR